MMIVFLLLSPCVCLAITRSYERSPGERIDFTFDLEPNSCNIYFFPENNLKLKALGTEIVRQGRLERKDLDEVNCVGFQLSKPCGILIESLQSSCGGRFEVRDQNGNKALVASLKMKRRVKRKSRFTLQGNATNESGRLAFGCGVFLLVVICCVFMVQCCLREDNSENEAVAASVPEYDAVGLRSDVLSQPSRTNYPARPSYTPSGPQVDDPTDNVPPSYSELAASEEHSVVPSAPFYSNDGPRFEIKGMTFPSDSASVYTSDKLNFL